MTEKRILLTGASGMVGKSILEHPDINRFEFLTPSREELNLFDFNAVSTYLEKHKPDVIIHAAGKVGGIEANIKEPVNFMIENLDVGRNILLGARINGIKELINIGSSCMYPKNHTEPLSEDLILKGELEPTNEGYALSKIATARLCDYIGREDINYKYKTLIPCNLYGRYDNFDPKSSHLIAAIIHKLHQAKLNKKKSVEIWGNGLARREFMYAGDLGDLILRAIDNFDSLPNYMNVGLGFDLTVNEYYHLVADVIGFKCEFTYDKSKPVGMSRKLVSIDRLSRWGWKSKTHYNDGIKKTYDFYLKNFK